MPQTRDDRALELYTELDSWLSVIAGSPILRTPTLKTAMAPAIQNLMLSLQQISPAAMQYSKLTPAQKAEDKLQKAEDEDKLQKAEWGDISAQYKKRLFKQVFAAASIPISNMNAVIGTLDGWKQKLANFNDVVGVFDGQMQGGLGATREAMNTLTAALRSSQTTLSRFVTEIERNPNSVENDAELKKFFDEYSGVSTSPTAPTAPSNTPMPPSSHPAVAPVSASPLAASWTPQQSEAYISGAANADVSPPATNPAISRADMLNDKQDSAQNKAYFQASLGRYYEVYWKAMRNIVNLNNPTRVKNYLLNHAQSVGQSKEFIMFLSAYLEDFEKNVLPQQRAMLTPSNPAMSANPTLPVPNVTNPAPPVSSPAINNNGNNYAAPKPTH